MVPDGLVVLDEVKQLDELIEILIIAVPLIEVSDNDDVNILMLIVDEVDDEVDGIDDDLDDDMLKLDDDEVDMFIILRLVAVLLVDIAIVQIIS